MPVVPTPLELSYLRNHLHTLHRYVNTSAVYEFFIVTPDKQLKDVRAFLDEAVPTIVPEARQGFFRLVPEGECVSELASGTKYETNKVNPHHVFLSWADSSTITDLANRRCHLAV